MKAVKFNDILVPVNIKNSGMPLDDEKARKLFPQIKLEVQKYALKIIGKEGLIQVYTTGDYRLAFISFEEGKLSKKDAENRQKFDLFAPPADDVEELDDMGQVYWEILWLENQMRDTFKSNR